MKYSELLKEDYVFILYRQIIATLALYRRRPFRVVQYENDSKTITLILFSETKSGSIVTRHVSLSKPDAVFFRAWLAQDFPSLEIESIEGDAYGEESIG